MTRGEKAANLAGVVVPFAGVLAATLIVENAKVTQPASLSPAGQTVGALTVTGLLTAQAGLTVSAGATSLQGTTVTSLTDSGLTQGQVVFPGAARACSYDHDTGRRTTTRMATMSARRRG